MQGGRAGGRGVALVPVCTALTDLALLVAATREAIEQEGVDVLIGPYGATEGPLFRRLAARYPDVTFLAGPSPSREETLPAPQPNLFRFTPDGAQAVGGLGTYAYRDLGWRTAVVVGDDFADSWEVAAGFVTEFCALGGRVIERDWEALQAEDPAVAAARHARIADGVAVLDTWLPPAAYLQALAASGERLDEQVVLGGPIVHDRAMLTAEALDLTGVIAAGTTPLAPAAAAVETYLASYGDAFPELTPEGAPLLAVLPYYTAMAALASALDATGGELGRDQAALRAQLSEVTVQAPQGPVRLDANRQAIARVYLQRIASAPDGPVLSLARVVDGVEQGFGGAIDAAAPQPTRTQPACRRAPPPPWAG